MQQKQILTELQFKAIRSSGPGGQHANKVSSKDDKIIIYEVVQSASNLEVLGEVLKFKSEGSSFGGR